MPMMVMVAMVMVAVVMVAVMMVMAWTRGVGLLMQTLINDHHTSQY